MHGDQNLSGQLAVYFAGMLMLLCVLRALYCATRYRTWYLFYRVSLAFVDRRAARLFALSCRAVGNHRYLLVQGCP